MLLRFGVLLGLTVASSEAASLNPPAASGLTVQPICPLPLGSFESIHTHLSQAPVSRKMTCEDLEGSGGLNNLDSGFSVAFTDFFNLDDFEDMSLDDYVQLQEVYFKAVERGLSPKAVREEVNREWQSINSGVVEESLPQQAEVASVTPPIEKTGEMQSDVAWTPEQCSRMRFPPNACVNTFWYNLFKSWDNLNFSSPRGEETPSNFPSPPRLTV